MADKKHLVVMLLIFFMRFVVFIVSILDGRTGFGIQWLSVCDAKHGSGRTIKIQRADIGADLISKFTAIVHLADTADVFIR